MRAWHNRKVLDYSQHGQALILQQLVTVDTPKILVDIGAHDGITNSNSSALVEQGWRAQLSKLDHENSKANCVSNSTTAGGEVKGSSSHVNKSR